MQTPRGPQDRDLAYDELKDWGVCTLPGSIRIPQSNSIESEYEKLKNKQGK